MRKNEKKDIVGKNSERNIITIELYEKYLDITTRALKKAQIAKHLSAKEHAWALDYHDMASRYVQDAKFFFEKKDLVNAFGCIYYAHGWLDAGARIGIFDVGKDNVLFTVDDS